MASRGFGFVAFENPEVARDGLQAVNGKSRDGCQIRVGHAKERSGGGCRYGRGSSYSNSGRRRGVGGGYRDSDRRGSHSSRGRYDTGDWDSFSGGYKDQGG